MSNLTQKNKIFRNTLFLIILAELLSFLGYYYPPLNYLAFFVVAILTIFLSLYRLEYGLFILLAELFVSSFGYLFYFDLGGTKISIRMALWLIIMSVWLAKTILEWIKNKRLNFRFIPAGYFIYLAILAIFIAWGLINGRLNNNSLNNIFFDFNNWLYFLLIFPLASLAKGDYLRTVGQIFFASITWLTLKTYLLAYFFSHRFSNFIIDLYSWVRISGGGEITQVQAGFSRIFLQSQIFILIGLFILIFYLLKNFLDQGDHLDEKGKIFRWRDRIIYFLLIAAYLGAIIISFSRSYWIGLAAGAIFASLIFLFKIKIKFRQLPMFAFVMAGAIIFSLILVLAVVKFPFPAPSGGFNPADLLEQRATQVANEAGASSRWQLLPELWRQIKTSPLAGQGFGTTVTYKTSDPRILASNPDGLYTTYAFEWGWLDIWLKFGLLGLLAYLVLIAKVVKDGLKINTFLSLSLSTGLLILATVNVFSPYVNHPLGIGYLLLTVCFINSAQD